MSDPNDDHVRVRPIERGLEVFCERCRAKKTVMFPILASDMPIIMRDFIAAHEACEPMPETIPSP